MTDLRGPAPPSPSDLALLGRVVGWRLRITETHGRAAERLERAGLIVVTVDASGWLWAACTCDGAELAEERTAGTRRTKALDRLGGRRGAAARARLSHASRAEGRGPRGR